MEGIVDFAIGSDGYVQMINHIGKTAWFDLYNKELDSLKNTFECNVSKFDTTGICEGGYYVLPRVSSYIIKYEKVTNEEKKIHPADEKMREDMKEIWNFSKDCTEEAKKIGISNPELVENILYIHENIAMVTYSDDTMYIYDVINEASISFIKNIESAPVKYFGRDYERNIYVAGITHGYIFDEEYNLIAKIEDMKLADVEKGYMVIGDITGELWEFPMYSLSRLIDKAEKEMAGKN